MTIITHLRSPSATLIVLCSALLAQLPHAADVFRLIVMGQGLWPTLHSYTYAVALELAVLLFVVQRRNVESYLFAGVSILVNLSYYHLHGVHLWSVAAAPAWLVSIALPAAIAQYSHLIAAATDAHVAQPAPEQTHAADDATPPMVQQGPDIAHLLHLPDVADLLGDIAQQDARATALQMASEGVPVAQIAAQVNANQSTVRSWLRRAKVKQNGDASE